MPEQTVHCVVERAAKLSEPTRKKLLYEPLAYDNAYAHSMRYRAYNDDGTEADLTGYSVVGAFTPSGRNTIKPLLNGTVTGNVAELILPSACYKHPGRFKFTMNLNKGSVSRSVLWVEGMVERNQTDTIEAPTEILDVSQVIADAQTAAAEANAARDRANTLANTLVNNSVNAISTAAAQQRQSVNDLGDQLKSYMSEHYSETITKAEAKVNRSSVSTVKHAIGADGTLTLTDALNEPAKKMTIHLEPKQDLHGYDHPWVGGTGKNKLEVTAASGTSGDVAFTVNADGSVLVNGSGQSDRTTWIDLHLFDTQISFSEDVILSSGVDSTGVVKLCWFKENAGSGDYIATKDGVTVPANTPLKGISIGVMANQTASNVLIKPMIRSATVADPTYEPYSNICPIEGFDSIQVTSVGKNLLNPNKFVSRNGQSNVHTITVNGNTITMNGYTAAGRFVCFNAKTDVGKEYTVHYSTITNIAGVGVVESDTEPTVWLGWGATVSKTYTYTATKPWTQIYIEESNDNSAITDFQLEQNKSYTGYEPFLGNTVSINLVSSAGSTVYGGTVTVNEDGSGTLAVDKGCRKVNDSEWRIGTDETSSLNYYYTIDVSDIPGAAAITSDRYVNVASGLVGRTPGTIGRNNGDRLYINDQNYSDVSAFLAAVGDSKYYYDLAAPIFYNLTATQLRTIINKNYIFTDGTSIELDYYADKYGLVDRLLAAFPKDTAVGNPASFTDGADDLPIEKLEVAIEPKQDLHGFDRPWVGGAGKNLLPITVDRIKNANANRAWIDNACTINGVSFTILTDGDGNVVGINVNGTSTSNTSLFLYKETSNGTHVLEVGTNYTITHGLDTGVLGLRVDMSDDVTSTIVANKTFIYSQEFNSRGYHAKIYITANSSFRNIVVKPMIRLASETDSTFAPYSNICHIEGFDKATVRLHGTNVWDEAWEVGYVDMSGNLINTSGYIRSKNYISVIPGKSYYCKTNGNNMWVCKYDKNKQFIPNSREAYNDIVLTIPENCHYIKFNMGQTYGGTYKNDLSINYPANITEYSAFRGNAKLSIPLKSVAGKTVYGGTLTVNRDGTGTLVVDRAVTTLADKTFGDKQSSTLAAGGYIPITGFTSRIDASTAIKSDMLVGTTFNNRGVNGSISPAADASSVSSLVLFTTKTKDEAVAAYKNATICYKLVTTATYPLTSPQITTLLGSNHISCDAGEVTVTYHADPTLFITKKIAQALNA